MRLAVGVVPIDLTTFLAVFIEILLLCPIGAAFEVFRADEDVLFADVVFTFPLTVVHVFDTRGWDFTGCRVDGDLVAGFPTPTFEVASGLIHFSIVVEPFMVRIEWCLNAGVNVWPAADGTEDFDGAAETLPGKGLTTIIKIKR